MAVVSNIRKISVVIPVYNCADFIAATLESIRRQDESSVEIILVDGGSTDGTVQIAEAAGFENLRVISEPDRGQLDALQKGLKAATGDILVWINGDDIVMPRAFETVLAVFRDNPDVDFVYSDDAGFDEKLQTYGYGSTIKNLNDLDHILFYRQMYSECVYWKNGITRFLDDSYFDLRVYTDYAFFLNLRWGRKGRWVPQRLGAFRIREGQASAAFGMRKKTEYIRVRRAHMQRIGLNETRIAVLRAAYWPWFALRQIVRPSMERLVRKTGRILSRDRRRKAETAWFFGEWLKPAPTRNVVEADIPRKAGPG